jgi:hypothetical protein
MLQCNIIFSILSNNFTLLYFYYGGSWRDSLTRISNTFIFVNQQPKALQMPKRFWIRNETGKFVIVLFRCLGGSWLMRKTWRRKYCETAFLSDLNIYRIEIHIFIYYSVIYKVYWTLGSSDFGTLTYLKLIRIAERIVRSKYKIRFLAIAKMAFLIQKRKEFAL